ncbi:ubiquitin carboxyl-terminal hydrolase 21-like isoform X3 [Pimephales promelas]|uniref:ubiquitin carboxyl-terminal hydrolase 21-like isoform X3 n=1 Tax=Pimephales promelas TaxID=90988 RepID=UPI0019559CD9|nr:ubiquitin carboxyl-terminal hydrolase 21-like isoform X3 [Pimephales promelas]
MIITVIRKHLQPCVHQPAIKTRYSFYNTVFPEVGKVNQTQLECRFKCVPTIRGHFVLQDFNVSELKRLPFFILLKIQHSPVIILPTYIKNIDIRMNDSDSFQSSPHRKRRKEDNPHKCPEHASPSGGQLDQFERPSKKMKETVPSASETDTSTSLDNVLSCVQNKAENYTQQNIDHHGDTYYVENEVSGIKTSRQHTDESSINIENNHDSSVSNEQDPPAPLNTNDSNPENEAKPSQTEREDKDIEIDKESNDYPSTPDVSSSTAESKNQSGTSDNNSLKERPASETSDTKPVKDNQPEEEKHPSPAQRRVPIRSKGYCGLVNQGATCYLNAVLQTLFMTEQFRTAVKELKKEEKRVSFELHKLFSNLESKTGSVKTNGVTNALDISNVCEQQDAAEYYQKILSEIDEKTAKVFQGKKKHSTTCIHGNHEPIEEIISFFSLAIVMDSGQSKINVQKSLNAQFEVMPMDGEDQLFCETCNTMADMEMKCTISELPEVLTLHLQRFYLDYNYMIYMKNNCPVKIPLQLSLQEKKDVHHRYDLYALVNHTGSLSGGHYFADIKSFDDHRWYQFNDSSVYRIRNVKDRHIISDMACLLFFRKYAQQEKTVTRSDKSKGLQRNRTSNPAASRQHTDHISVNIENNHDSSVSNEQDPPAPLNTNDSNPENEAKPSQTEREDKDIEIDKESNDYPSTPDVSSSTAESKNQSGTSDNNSLKERPASETSDTKPVKDNQPEEEKHPSPAQRREKEKPEREKPEESDNLLQQRTDSSTETEAKPSRTVIPDKELKSIDTDNDYQSAPNSTFRTGRVTFTSDSDKDEARAQMTSFLEERTVSRIQFPLWQGLLSGFILCLIFITIICIIIFTLFSK